MDKLKELLSRCKCSVTLTVNDHRDYYETAEQALDEAAGQDSLPEIEPEIRAAMIAADTIIKLQFYPTTPIGFYSIWHHDLDAALDIALGCFKQTDPQ